MYSNSDFDELDDFDFDDFDEDDIVLIEDEFGNEQEFFILDTVEHKGFIYLLVTPSEDEDENYEATILKFTGEENSEESVYSLIEDDNEFNEVAALFMGNDGNYKIEL